MIFPWLSRCFLSFACLNDELKHWKIKFHLTSAPYSILSTSSSHFFLYPNSFSHPWCASCDFSHQYRFFITPTPLLSHLELLSNFSLYFFTLFPMFNADYLPLVNNLHWKILHLMSFFCSGIETHLFFIRKVETFSDNFLTRLKLKLGNLWNFRTLFTIFFTIFLENSKLNFFLLSHFDVHQNKNKSSPKIQANKPKRRRDENFEKFQSEQINSISFSLHVFIFHSIVVGLTFSVIFQSASVRNSFSTIWTKERNCLNLNYLQSSDLDCSWVSAPTIRLWW